MGKVVHFEIHVNDMEQAKKFYGEVFGWTFETGANTPACRTSEP